MFGETLRAVAQADILALVTESLPAASVPMAPGIPRSR